MQFRWADSLVSCERKADSCLKKWLKKQQQQSDSFGWGLVRHLFTLRRFLPLFLFRVLVFIIIGVKQWEQLHFFLLFFISNWQFFLQKRVRYLGIDYLMRVCHRQVFKKLKVKKKKCCSDWVKKQTMWSPIPAINVQKKRNINNDNNNKLTSKHWNEKF